MPGYIAILIFIGIAGNYAKSRAPGLSTAVGIVVATSIPFFYIIEIMWLGLWRRMHYESYAASRLFSAVVKLDSGAKKWHTFKFRSEIARMIEGSARAIENIPASVSSPLLPNRVSPAIRAEAFRFSAGKANALRGLSLYTIRLDSSSYDDLLKNLVARLAVVAGFRWYELPDAEGTWYESLIIDEHAGNKSVRTKAILITLAVLVTIGIVVTAVLFSEKIGPAISLLSLIAGSVVIGLLENAGVLQHSVSSLPEQAKAKQPCGVPELGRCS